MGKRQAMASVIRCKDCEIVHKAKVYGLPDSVRRSKFPMSDDIDKLTYDITPGIKSLAQSKPGEGHDQWLNGVIVQFDLTFSNKAWVEAERYHFFDFVSSQSTMHRITRLVCGSRYNKYVDPRISAIMEELVAEYNKTRREYEKEESESKKKKLQEKLTDQYLKILYSNPAGFLLTAGMTTNYRQLKTIYKQRKNHRLPEWRVFCRWIETLPESYLITGDNVA